MMANLSKQLFSLKHAQSRADGGLQRMLATPERRSSYAEQAAQRSETAARAAITVFVNAGYPADARKVSFACWGSHDFQASMPRLYRLVNAFGSAESELAQLFSPGTLAFDENGCYHFRPATSYHQAIADSPLIIEQRLQSRELTPTLASCRQLIAERQCELDILELSLVSEALLMSRVIIFCRQELRQRYSRQLQTAVERQLKARCQSLATRRELTQTFVEHINAGKQPAEILIALAEISVQQRARLRRR
jgi:hypothetical protein